MSVANNAPASVTNTATVSGGGELNTTNDSASDPTNITIPAADLTISKSHTGNFTQGDLADAFTITANNIGSLATTGTVTVTDTLPTGLTPMAASGTGWSTTIVGSTVTATRSDALAAGTSYPALTITVSVANNAPASVTNTATVSGGGELNTTNDSASDATTITQVADLTISKSHTGNFTQGASADTYTITANNAGAGATAGTVTVTDTLPTGLTPTVASGTGWSTTIVGSTVTATRSDALAAGTSYPALTITVSVANNAPVSVTNTATVSGGGELNTANDTASDPTTINVSSAQLSGYVYFDTQNDGLRVTPQGQTQPALPGVTVKLLSQDSQGNWVEVTGKSPVQTAADGSYHFDKLLAATYRIQVVPLSNFLDGKDTAGTVGGTTRGSVSQDQIEVQLASGDTGTDYNFSMSGLQPRLISLRLFLASTPPFDQVLQTYLSQVTTAAAVVPAAVAATSLVAAQPGVSAIPTAVPATSLLQAQPSVSAIPAAAPSVVVSRPTASPTLIDAALSTTTGNATAATTVSIANMLASSFAMQSSTKSSLSPTAVDSVFGLS